MLRIIAALAILCALANTSQAQLRGAVDLDSLDQETPIYIELGGDVAWGPNSTFLYAGGLGVMMLVEDNLRLGLTDVNYAAADQLTSDRHSLTFAPAVEYYTYLSKIVAIQGRLALPLQVRWGADLDSKLGVMPYFQAGLDLFPSERFSVGAFGRTGIVATDGFIRSPRVLPQSAIAIVGGLNFKFHF
jgi:hypothetical protein